MTVNISPRTAKTSGIGIVLLAGLLGVTLILTTPFAGCTDVGVEDSKNTGFEFQGIEEGSIVYSPDGVNECTSPVEVALVPLGGFSIGVGVFIWGQVRSDRQ